MIPNSVVVDTNLIFSALIPKASQIRELFFENKLIPLLHYPLNWIFQFGQEIRN